MCPLSAQLARVAVPLIDAVGTAHAPVAESARIVSLVPSLTETLFDLGLGEQVVGRTAFCVHPADQVRAVASVGGTKTINLQKLRRARPTHVLVNIDETPRALAEELATQGLTVVVTHPIEVSDNLQLFTLLGGLFGRRQEADVLCRRFEAAYERVREQSVRLPQRRVLYLIWKDPWMTVARDTYISRMLTLVRMRTLPAECERRYPQIEFTEALLQKVDAVLFSSEPFPFKERHVSAFREAFPQHATKAIAIDAQMVSWYGSRAVRGLEYLAELAASQR